MENQNVGDLQHLKRMFSDYQNKQSQAKKKRKSSEEILAKYFVPRNTKETFRILPPKPGRKHWDEAFFHVVDTNIKGGKIKHGTVIYCPAHNDPKVQKIGPDGKPVLDGNGNPIMIPAPCPLCDKAKKILAKQDPSIKGIKKENMNDAQKKINESNKKIFADANKWEAKKFYIFRGIDKGKTSDGVKFWRFKHNFRNQGNLDKLLPVLDAYVNAYSADFSDPQRGTDLILTMADSEFNGRPYKALSAVVFNPPSQLHNDPVVVEQWLKDNTTWRDVFLPKKAPGITAHQYLEMVAAGNSPYWDDIDQNNKHWVFPGHPELEAAANTRRANLDADEDENFEYASDLIDDEESYVSVSNVSQQNVGTFKDDAVEMTRNSSSETDEGVAEETDSSVDASDAPKGEYDDLPF